ncbi:MAG: nucleotidyltransferase domain-containing protein [Patescibacteria group bacterium]
MQVSEPKINELTRALKRIRGIQAAYLFGSQAKQSAGRLSDVDVAILIDRKCSSAAQREVVLTAFQTITRILGRNDIDLIELDRAPIILRYAATVHGRPLFVKPGQDTCRLPFRNLRDFEDFRPYLERRSRALKNEFSRV